MLKKLSINVLAKDADNTLFTLPLEGIELTREQLNETLGDRTFEAWFDQRKDGSYHPMPFFAARKDASFEIDEEFTCAGATIKLSGGKEIEFETIEADEDDPDSEDQPAAKISCLKFTPTSGGITKLAFHMQVRPGLGKNNLALQEHQFRTITVTLTDVEKSARKGQQQELPLAGSSEGERQVSGGFTQTTPASEVDRRMREQHPDSPTMGEDSKSGRESSPAVNGSTDGDSSSFEAGARAQVEAFNAKKGQVIDGRSERVKHRDRTRSGAH
jgi:hypothetical protein